MEIVLNKGKTLGDATTRAIEVLFPDGDGAPAADVEVRLRPCHLKTAKPTAPPLNCLEILGDREGADLETLGLWRKMVHHVVLEVGTPALDTPPPVTVPATVVLFTAAGDGSAGGEFGKPVEFELVVPSNGREFGAVELSTSVAEAIKWAGETKDLNVFTIDASGDGPPMLVRKRAAQLRV